MYLLTTYNYYIWAKFAMCRVGMGWVRHVPSWLDTPVWALYAYGGGSLAHGMPHICIIVDSDIQQGMNAFGSC